MSKSRHDVIEALRHLEFVAELIKLGQIGNDPESDDKLAEDMVKAISLLRSLVLGQD